MDAKLCTPHLRSGMQVHMPYTVYAHWFLPHRLLNGAGVHTMQASMDIDSMSRASFLCTFAEEVLQGRAHGFYVRHAKHQTVDERRRLMEENRRERAAFRRTLPMEVQGDSQAVSRAMMQAQFANGAVYGKWKDEWYRLPLTHHERTAESRLLTYTDGRALR